MQKQLIEILGDGFKDKIETAMETFHLICGNTGVLQKYSEISAFLGRSPNTLLLLIHPLFQVINLF